MAISHFALETQERLVAHTLRSNLVLFFLVPFAYIAINEFIRVRARIPKLNGPRGLPLIGNIWDIRTNAAERYPSAAKLMFGQNSRALASRPEFYTFHKVLSDTAGTTIGTSPYSDSLKRRRKGAASALNRPSVSTYVMHLDVESRDFIGELFTYGRAGKEPVDPMPMIQRLSLSLSLTLNWGVRMSSQKESLFHEITHVEEEISRFRSTTGNL
ncbi:hypothetical protein DL769_004886 [Monosporascus sp. CRB-8-3]|nr:hypothetical protein DL769_004886 [Monosporascus sp. CRB-8-3]